MADEVVDIRPAEPADAARLLKLLKRLSHESNTFTVDEGLGQLSERDECQQIEQLTRTTTNTIFVAALGAQLIGVATVQATEGPTVTKGEVGVAVLKEFWGMGLGTALVEELIHWARDFSTLKQLVLTVQLRNTRAAKLYQHLGFKESTPQAYDVVDPTGAKVAAVDMVLAV
ncbi:GNAT family N-acetyltransferase [Lactiplantibacillus garii]|uniref:GNAT family N-acetyltransferase n=1 Tax=Lactiplantibacillus garii TaxID=2306423 RepID=A0A426D9U5_9LACO|nr:GNAT family N-acetyltransferase [Lactiplantibacillus garii]RRK11434.1 GNAT family N-acetyltransferase [Lactiplantibacillus garii]